MRSFKSQEQINEEARQAAAATHTTYDTKRKLLLYARQSTKQQLTKNKESVAMQTVKLREQAIQYGWSEQDTTLYIENKFNRFGVITEEIRSASASLSIDERPGLQTVIERIETGEVGAILVYAIDRLFRDEDMIAPPAFIKTCKDFHTLVISQSNGDFDFNNPRRDDRKRFLELAQAAADYTTHHVRGRMHVGKHDKAMRGEFAGWSIATGYMLDDVRQHYIPNPYWDTIVASLFTRFRELDADFAALHREIRDTMLFPDIPHDMRERIGRINMAPVEGGYTVKGRTSLMAFLTNPIYIGHMVYRGQIVKYHAHPPIVSEDDFYFAFNALSKTDLQGNPIERPDKVVRYTHTDSEETHALLVGKRVNGKAVITSPQRNVYCVHYSNEKKATRYSVRNNKAHDTEDFSIQASAIDTLLEERLLYHLDPQLSVEETDEETFTKIDLLLEQLDFVKANPDASLTSMHDQFQAVQMQHPTRVTTDENVRSELHRAIARLDREYEVNFDVLSDKELHENREKKARHNKQLADLDHKQEQAKHAEKDMQEATALLHSENPREQWQAMPIEKRRKFIRLMTEDVIIEKVADGWLKLTIKWYAWIAQYKPHQALQQGLLFVDVGYLLRRPTVMVLWTDEEKDILKALYRDASQQDIRECLPTRSWESIKIQGTRHMRILRERYTHEGVLPTDLSLHDVQFMHTHNLDMARLEQRVWWTCDVVRNDDYHHLSVVTVTSRNSTYILQELKALLQTA